MNQSLAEAIPKTPPDVAADAKVRIDYLRKWVWAPYKEATDALTTMKRFLGEPNQLRPESLALIGEPNYGKSAILERFLAMNPQPYDPSDEDVAIPIVAVELPTKSSDAALMRELISAMGANYSVKEPVDEMVRRFVRLADVMHVKLIVIDEFHNGFPGTVRQQREFLNLTRALTNRTRRPMVVAGTEEVENFITNDPQLDQRFSRIRIPRWTADIDGRRLLKGFEMKLGLRNPSNLDSVPMLELIMDLANGRLGNIARLLVSAAEAAIVDGSEVLTPDLLRSTAKRLPGKRLEAA